MSRRQRSAQLPPVRAELQRGEQKTSRELGSGSGSPQPPPGADGRAGPSPQASSRGGGRRVPANMALCRPVARPGWRVEPLPAHTEGPTSRAGAPGCAAAARGEGEAAATVTTAGPGRPGPALEGRE